MSPALRKPLYITAFVFSKGIRQKENNRKKKKQNVEKQTQIAVGQTKPIHIYFCIGLAVIKHVLIGVLTVMLKLESYSHKAFLQNTLHLL